MIVRNKAKPTYFSVLGESTPCDLRHSRNTAAVIAQMKQGAFNGPLWWEATREQREVERIAEHVRQHKDRKRTTQTFISALGQKQTLPRVHSMSDLPSKTDI